MKYSGARVQRIRRAIYTRDKGICQLCGEPANFNTGNVDHIIPRTLGGTERGDNLRWTHKYCPNGTTGNNRRTMRDYVTAVQSTPAAPVVKSRAW